jgi:hypothetical protein
MARTPDPKLHVLWRERIDRQVRSGLTIAQFCTRERLSESSFSNWNRRLRLSALASHRPFWVSNCPSNSGIECSRENRRASVRNLSGRTVARHGCALNRLFQYTFIRLRDSGVANRALGAHAVPPS